MQKKKIEKFLPLKEAYLCIKSKSLKVHSTIPHGDKSNCSMLLDLERIKSENGGKVVYFDDCGPYKNPSSHKYFLLTPDLRHIFLKNGVWYYDALHKKLCDKIDTSLVIEMSILTSKLKSNEKFKRQITKIVGENVALVEYIGKFLFKCLEF